MMRFISILLLLGGILVAGIGAATLMDHYRPAGQPAPEMTFDAPPPPPPRVEAARAEPAPAEPGDTADIASAGEDDYNFQPMLEAAPPGMTIRSAAPVDIGDPDVTAAVSASFLDSLKTVPVAHETPRSAEYKRPFDVTFAINATGSGEDAAGALPGRGIVGTGEALVSERVEVRVSGAAFSITPTSPPVQMLSPITDNTWRWSVTALTAGDHDLTFEIFAIDADNVVPLRTFRDTVTVRVSGINRAIAFADQANPLFVLLGGLGSAIAGLVGAMRFFRRR